MKEPEVNVGILSEPQIEFVLLTSYRVNGKTVCDKQTAVCENDKILWQGDLYDELEFIPAPGIAGVFELINVTIGINFHWERKENQRFQGVLKLIAKNGKLTGINRIASEDYLISVIASEMSATASLELLKAHAVISRSWLLAQIMEKTDAADVAFTQTGEELIRWYDRSAHSRFDVCADDHCQRYQGITRASTDIVNQAVAATRGQVLTSEGKICDARFSKCCGGAFEEFQYCWNEATYPYLSKQRDSKTETALPDLRQETAAEQWIRSFPKAFCNTKDKKILSQVLNNYDRETADFFRWRTTYNQDELSELIRRRSGIDFGNILDLIPVARGVSGRLVKLKIVGSKKTMIIGKELEIRRILSPSHLYSSAFVVDKERVGDDIPQRFILSGAGWGHGVGLCQIGAAVMGEEGYAYNEILLHYYRGAKIEKWYE
jgi:SpoIID/LytB domain protein